VKQQPTAIEPAMTINPLDATRVQRTCVADNPKTWSECGSMADAHLTNFVTKFRASEKLW